MKKYYKYFIVGLMSQILAACTSYQYDYQAPSDPEGLACTRSCMDYKWDCSNRCQENHSRCMSNALMQDTLVDLGTMISGNANQDRRKATQGCNTESCNSGCEANYNSCYKNCGGTIRVYEVK
jgi:hypothetical protein